MFTLRLGALLVLFVSVLILLVVSSDTPLVQASTCGCKFVRGDANNDGSVAIADTIYLLGYLQSGGPAPCNMDAGDANDDGSVNIADTIYLLAWLFGGGSAPPSPFSTAGCDCSSDSLEPCCSPPGGTGGFTHTAVSATYTGSPSWDHNTPQAHAADKRMIDLICRNNGACSVSGAGGHQETQTNWTVTWSISETYPGSNKDAFKTGAVQCLQMWGLIALKCTVSLFWRYCLTFSQAGSGPSR